MRRSFPVSKTEVHSVALVHRKYNCCYFISGTERKRSLSTMEDLILIRRKSEQRVEHLSLPRTNHLHIL